MTHRKSIVWQRPLWCSVVEPPTSPKQLELRVIPAKLACELNRVWHSRLPKIDWTNIVRNPPYLCLMATYGERIYATAIWSGPVGRGQGGNVLELRRLAIAEDAPKYTASWMLGAMKRLIINKYPEITKLITYQDLEVHSGTIYKASGWVPTRKVNGRSWSKPKRKRSPAQSLADKRRWELIIRD